MDKKMQIKQPRYQLIAEDIATKIVERKYVVGEKIYARSSLASQYGVSPETTRRAIAVLQDLNIVEATKGSGVEIARRGYCYFCALLSNKRIVGNRFCKVTF